MKSIKYSLSVFLILVAITILPSINTQAATKVKCPNCGLQIAKIYTVKYGDEALYNGRLCWYGTGYNYACSKCGRIIKKTATGSYCHKKSKLYKTKNATCTATGYKKYKCTECGTITKTIAIPKKNHSFNTTKKESCTKSGKLSKSGKYWKITSKCTKCGYTSSKISKK